MKTKFYPCLYRLIVFVAILLAGLPSFSQTKINDGTVGGSSLPNSSAILEVESNNKGILLSRVSLTTTSTWGLAGATPVAGMLVYNTNAAITSSTTKYPVTSTGIGCYFWDGTGWVAAKMDVPKSIADTTYWTVKGNASTSSGVNFLGTTDNHPLVIKTNNILAGYVDSTGGNSTTTLGYKAINKNIGGGYTGIDNTAIGNYAMQNTTTGSYNTALGDSALLANTTGNWNTAVGQYALVANTTGILNTGIGQFALGSNSTGGDNTAIGQGALGTNNAGWSNTAVGQNALSANQWASNNTAVGQSALAANTTGGSNIGVGQNSMSVVSTGSNNVGVGNNIMSNPGAGAAANNTAIGINALQFTTGNNNTAAGYQAIVNNTSGTDNTIIGYNTGSSITSGSNNIIIGSGTDAASANASNSLNIGNTIYATNTNAATRKVGINTTTPVSTLQVSGSFALPIATTNTSVTLDDTYYTVIITGGNPTITFPAAAGNTGKIYKIVNQTAANRTTSAYFNLAGTSVTAVAATTAIEVQSNGTSWYRIQ